MAQLVSPGLSITVTDESQYVPAGQGTVPLVILATAQDKTSPATGTTAIGTTAANANRLQAYGSQRELINAFGYPIFKTSAGTSLHGHEQNEYGLQAAYSALGLGNRMFALRADIDLAQLTATSIRPRGDVADGFVWLDLATTGFGIYEWNASTQSYTIKVPTIITSTDDVNLPAGGTPIHTPKDSIGEIGSYAIIVIDSNNPVFYKNEDNQWVAIGTTDWQKSWATSQSSIPTYNGNEVPDGTVITINTVAITISAAGATATGNEVITAINNAMGYADKGVEAELDGNGRLILKAISTATSNGVDADGRIVITESADAELLGFSTDANNLIGYAPSLTYGGYTEVPTYGSGDSSPAPTGSIWLKTTVVGGGANWAFKAFNAVTSSFASVSAPMYDSRAEALFGLDSLNGGFGLAIGTIFVDYATLSAYPGTFRAMRRFKSGATKVTGAVPASSTPFINDGTNTFKIAVTQPGQATIDEYSFTITDSSVDGFVRMILARGIPNVFASKESTGAISITHKAGGEIYLVDTTAGTDNPLTDGGFTSSTTGVVVETTGLYAGALLVSNWANLAYTYSTETPYVAPADGTKWYYGSAVEADILICDTSGWKGYRTLTSDARGYNLSLTDSNGPIFSASRPTLQSSGSPLVKGDLWVDTSDLENYPKISRYNGTTWVSIDNTDRITQNGVLFADARWDASVNGNGDHVGGIIDPVTGTVPVISTMLLSNYIDLDCPDYRLYPRGTILWNTRRNGFNVKEYISDKFTELAYPDAAVQSGVNTVGYIPEYSATWVTASGNQDNGSPYMGRKAQRQMVVKALKAAIDSNAEIREEQFSFNLIVCPGYPELISNMVALNNDRSNTAFIIGDTPMDLKPNTIDLTEWSNNVATTADVYAGIFYPAGLTNDLNGNEVAVPPSHVALRTIIKSDSISFPWFAPAGARRGLVDNATSVGYVDYTSGLFVKTGIRQSLRDTLYTLRLNPIANLPGLGLAVFGQKTRSPIPQSTDRINVARLVNYIRTILSGISNSFLFEPNDKITRDQIKQVIEGAMNDLVAKRGIYDYLVVCDNSNNTSDRIARNELYVDIAIEPMKAVEFIYIPVRLKNPGTIGGGA
jgi:hypothetical protein